jgi:hypothetical protein
MPAALGVFTLGAAQEDAGSRQRSLGRAACGTFSTPVPMVFWVTGADDFDLFAQPS